MNGNLVKKELYFLMKNPITYVGIIIMILIVTVIIRPYLSLFNHLRENGGAVTYSSDGDIDTGYIPTPSDEIYEMSLQSLQEWLVQDNILSEKDAEDEIKNIRENQWSIEQIAGYMKDNYAANGVKSLFDQKRYKHASFEQMKNYLQNAFQDRTFTKSFSYKYSDFLSIGSILFTIIVFSILLSRDSKKDIYLLLHTKPITGKTYILSKLAAGIIFTYTIIIFYTAIINILAVRNGRSYGFGVSYWDIWKSVAIFNLPNIVLTGCLVVFITLLFRNVIPAIPTLVLYFIYSNMGSTNTVSEYVYQIKPFVLLIRFPGEFATLTIPRGVLINQFFVISLSVLLIIYSIRVWERRRSA